MVILQKELSIEVPIGDFSGMNWGEYTHLKRLYYQINYTLTDVPDDVACLHAQFRRTNPNPYRKDITEPHAPLAKLPAKDVLAVN